MALATLKGEHLMSKLATEYGVHSTIIHPLTKAVLDRVADIFGRSSRKRAEVDEETVRSLHARTGELVVAGDPPQGLRDPAPMRIYKVPFELVFPVSISRHYRNRARGYGSVPPKEACGYILPADWRRCHPSGRSQPLARAA